MSYRGNVWVPPNNSTFTNLNLQTGSSITNVGSGKALFYQPVTGDNIQGQQFTAPATPYCVIGNLVCNQGDYVSASYTNDRSIMFGLGFYDGTKAVWGGANWNSASDTMGYNIYHWSNLSTVAATQFGQRFASGQPTGMIQWFQVRDDGTNIYFYIAMDGTSGNPPTHWVKIYSEARTSYLSAPTYIIWAADDSFATAATPAYFTLNSWQVVAL